MIELSSLVAVFTENWELEQCYFHRVNPTPKHFKKLKIPVSLHSISTD